MEASRLIPIYDTFMISRKRKERSKRRPGSAYVYRDCRQGQDWDRDDRVSDPSRRIYQDKLAVARMQIENSKVTVMEVGSLVAATIGSDRLYDSDRRNRSRGRGREWGK